MAYRLIDPGSEWRLHRHWYANSAMGDLLGEEDTLAAKDTLYRCLDLLLEHKRALFENLSQRWQDLFADKLFASVNVVIINVIGIAAINEDVSGL